MTYQLTDEQISAVELAKTGSNMKLSAYAGAGKTSTLVSIAQALEMQNKSGYYLAFNRDIANEASKKMPRNVFSSTFHALALNFSPQWVKNKLRLPVMYPKEFASRYRLAPMQVNMVRENFLTKLKTIKKGTLSVTSQKYIVDKALTHFMKTAALEPKIDHVKYVVDKYSSVAPSDADYVADILLRVVQNVWSDYIDPNIGVRISHDCYLKLWAMSNPILNTDFILFDEAQDADPIMYQVLVNQRCQVIYVGDQYQQIYSWRGAVNMMQRLDNLNMPARFITKSFRFSPVLANYANPVLQYMGAKADIRGLENLDTVIDFTNAEPTDVDAILTRTNMTAIEILFDYAKLGKVGVARNIDLEDTLNLLKAIDAFKQDSSTGRTHNILKWFSDFDELLAYQHEYPSDRDILPTLQIYQNFGLAGSTEIISRCIRAERTEEYDFIVTTAHRSKGLEFDNVMLADDFTRQFENAEGLSMESISQTNDEELRLLYVAVTRAKKKLYAFHVQTLMSLIAGEEPEFEE